MVTGRRDFSNETSKKIKLRITRTAWSDSAGHPGPKVFYRGLSNRGENSTATIQRHLIGESKSWMLTTFNTRGSIHGTRCAGCMARGSSETEILEQVIASRWALDRFCSNLGFTKNTSLPFADSRSWRKCRCEHENHTAESGRKAGLLHCERC